MFFGFNITWRNFQQGYWREGRVRPEVVEWLRPFRGAVYRYPGGTESNFFEWYKTIGPVDGRQAVVDQFKRASRPEFGFAEYLDFVRQVNGIPLVVANLRGPAESPWPVEAAARTNAEWVRRANLQDFPLDGADWRRPCEPGKACPVRLWEMGNEMDWKSTNWTGEAYVARVREIGKAMLEADPDIHLIANSATAPWSDKQKAADFNAKVGALRDMVAGYSIHPYYDGMPIPDMEAHIARMQQQVGEMGANRTKGVVDVYVTEHARWPAKPLIGDWKANWSQTGDMGGALSTADFMLMALQHPEIRTTIWHALGAGGPWQLFQINRHTGQPYPNVVYWALRALRTGLLDQVLPIQLRTPNVGGYKGGYDVRAAVMRETGGSRLSMMTVNRAYRALRAVLVDRQFAGQVYRVTHYGVSASDPSQANDDDAPQRTVMRARVFEVRFDGQGRALFDLAPYSVSTFLLEPVQ